MEISFDCLFLIFDYIHIVELFQLRKVSSSFRISIDKYVKLRNLNSLIFSFEKILKKQKNLEVSLVDIAMYLNQTNVLEYSLLYTSLKNKEFPIIKLYIDNYVFCCYGINHAIRCFNCDSIKWYTTNYPKLKKSVKLKDRGILSKSNLIDIFTKDELKPVAIFLYEKYIFVRKRINISQKYEYHAILDHCDVIYWHFKCLYPFKIGKAARVFGYD
jgi:hypothetical protein